MIKPLDFYCWLFFRKTTVDAQAKSQVLQSVFPKELQNEGQTFYLPPPFFWDQSTNL